VDQEDQGDHNPPWWTRSGFYIVLMHDHELLAIVQAFHEWKRYTRGSLKPVQVLTDHKNLVTFMTTKEPSERQARWMQELSQYNFKIEYRPGK